MARMKIIQLRLLRQPKHFKTPATGAWLSKWFAGKPEPVRAKWRRDKKWRFDKCSRRHRRNTNFPSEFDDARRLAPIARVSLGQTVRWAAHRGRRQNAAGRCRRK